MPSIYTFLALSFLALSLQMVITDFHLNGFNKNVLVSISCVMAGILFVASWFSWKKSFKEKPAGHYIGNITLRRFGKILVAGYGIAFASSLLVIVFGTWLFGFEIIDSFITNYWTYTLLVITGISLPFVHKYLL